MLVPRTEHVYDRPGWDCGVCGATWPCATAEVELSEQYARSPTALSLYLASCLWDAIEDLTVDVRPSPPDLFERFLGWARSRRPTS